jgi:uncharacterized protein (DUF2141 family)
MLGRLSSGAASTASSRQACLLAAAASGCAAPRAQRTAKRQQVRQDSSSNQHQPKHKFTLRSVESSQKWQQDSRHACWQQRTQVAQHHVLKELQTMTAGRSVE